MWANLQDEIRQKAELLRTNGYQYTGKWCDHIGENLHQYAKARQMLKSDLDDLYSTFKQEYVSRTDLGSREYREKYLGIVQILLEDAISNSPNPKQMFTELLPFLDQGTNTSRTISEVSKVFGDMDERFLEVRAYASLFIFMLHVEGQFFPTIRTLCGMKLAGKGKVVTYQAIDKMTYEDLKKGLGRFGKPLFLAYDDLGRKLRNAIAHANFRYEDGKLVCWNLKPKKRVEVWRQAFTYDELSTVVVDIYSISHVFLYWYMLRELTSKILGFVKRKTRES